MKEKISNKFWKPLACLQMAEYIINKAFKNDLCALGYKKAVK